MAEPGNSPPKRSRVLIPVLILRKLVKVFDSEQEPEALVVKELLESRASKAISPRVHWCKTRSRV